jgi:hypothetical protein
VCVQIRQEKLEVSSTLLVQRVYRGHLGRKAARRWCMKKAEMDAMAALLNASVINIQRVYRGHRGRTAAKEARIEMAEFINKMRTVDATEDEEDYWNTHPVARFQRDLKAIFRDAVADITGTKKLRQAQMAQLEEEDHEEDHDPQDDVSNETSGAAAATTTTK